MQTTCSSSILAALVHDKRIFIHSTPQYLLYLFAQIPKAERLQISTRGRAKG